MEDFIVGTFSYHVGKETKSKFLFFSFSFFLFFFFLFYPSNRNLNLYFFIVMFEKIPHYSQHFLLFFIHMILKMKLKQLIIKNVFKKVKNVSKIVNLKKYSLRVDFCKKILSLSF